MAAIASGRTRTLAGMNVAFQAAPMPTASTSQKTLFRYHSMVLANVIVVMKHATGVQPRAVRRNLQAEIKPTCTTYNRGIAPKMPTAVSIQKKEFSVLWVLETPMVSPITL